MVRLMASSVSFAEHHWRIDATVIGVKPADLTPAPRCRDHTTWPSATKRSRQKQRSRPPHAAPRPRRSRYALGRDGGEYSGDLGCDGSRAFCKIGLTQHVQAARRANQLLRSRPPRIIEVLSIALNQSFNGGGTVVSYLNNVRTTNMKLRQRR
jgi:hypothetical protein